MATEVVVKMHLYKCDIIDLFFQRIEVQWGTQLEQWPQHCNIRTK